MNEKETWQELLDRGLDRKVSDNNSGRTSYYDVPVGAETLNDLIEHKDMPFWRGEIFKSCYRINGKDGTTEIRELNKIIYNANRRLAAINKAQVKKYEQLVS